MARWVKLAKAAEVAVRAPRAPAEALRRARKRTKGCPVPKGPPTRAHPICRLAFTTDAFLAAPSGWREARAADLVAALAVALPMLGETAEGGAPVRAERLRRDIHDMDEGE